MFVAVAAVGGMVSDYKRRRLELEPLRAAIERGQSIDPAVLERLMSPPKDERQGLNPLYLRIGGIMSIATGIGIAIMSFFIRMLAPPAFWPLIGAGALVICIGVGLLVAAGAIEQHRRGGPGPVA